MKYKKEYEKYVKGITDKYISMVTGELPIQYFDGHSWCDGPARIPTKEEDDEFYRKNNEWAIKWLQENMLPYVEWLKKNPTEV